MLVVTRQILKVMLIIYFLVGLNLLLEEEEVIKVLLMRQNLLLPLQKWKNPLLHLKLKNLYQFNLLLSLYFVADLETD